VRVVVNREAALGQKTGVGHYVAELLRALADQAGDDRIDCFPSGWLWQVRRFGVALRTAGGGEGGAVATATRPLSRVARARRAIVGGLKAVWGFLKERNARAAVLGRPCDLYHEPNHIPLPLDCRTLVTVHDLSALLYPQWHPPGRAAFFEKHFPRALTQACHFLTDTEFIRHELIERLGVAQERVTCVYLGIRRGLGPLPADEVAATLQRLGLPPRYLLYLGTIEPRKNLGLLLRAYCDLPDGMRADCPLLLVGRYGWGAADVARQLQEAGPARGVIHLGYVAEKHLRALYCGALALVYPSLYEGFGLPPLEMMACGGAVLTSTAGALVEVVGPQACLLDPHDLGGWRDAMAAVIRDAIWRGQLQNGARELARPFTWERCAAETLGVYRGLCGVPSTGSRRLAG
jgi:alpha-1,3-rhamnosyl/mannosyltransferase